MTKRRKLASIVTAVLGILLLAGIFLPSLQQAPETCSSRRALEVKVRVTDADQVPIHGAQVAVYEHPDSPEEGRLPKLDSRTHLLRTFATDSEGWCRLQQSGAVDPLHVWIKVSAANYQSTFVPLAGRSNPRDAKDESPLVNSIVLDRGSD